MVRRSFFATVAVGIAWMASAGAARGQECQYEVQPTYRQVVDGVRMLGTTMDTATIHGKRHVTVAVSSGGQYRSIMLGEPTAATVKDAITVCRIALLWSTRGDSIVASWLVTDSVIETTSDSLPGDIALGTKPEPGRYDRAPALRDRVIRDRLFEQLLDQASEADNRSSMLLLVLVDTIGSVVVARIARSSGSREVDEGALQIWRGLTYLPALLEGKLVPAWFGIPIRLVSGRLR